MPKHDNEKDDWRSPNEYSNPAERYAQLPETTRRWLESLRPADLKEMEDEREFWRSVKSTGRFLKWVVASSIAVLLLMAQFGEALQKFWHTFTGRTP